MSPSQTNFQLILTQGLCARPALQTLLAALEGGVDLVQVREKDLAGPELLEWVEAVVGICAPRGVPVLVNDDVDVAAKLGARVQGVHLGQGDMPVVMARARLGSDAWIGLSTHSMAEVIAAGAASGEGGAGRARGAGGAGGAGGATHLGLGACFATATKADHRVLTSGELERALAAATLPLFAIGGITRSNLPGLVARGVRRIAVSSAILASHDPARAAQEMRALLIP